MEFLQHTRRFERTLGGLWRQEDRDREGEEDEEVGGREEAGELEEEEEG
jgi:hypothetical protein